MKRSKASFVDVCNFFNLLKATKLAAKGKKEKEEVAHFLVNLENNLLDLQKSLLEKTYTPLPYFQFEIREPKVRKICASKFRDRVVHHAICNVIGQSFESRFIFDSYACRIGKGSHRALIRCQSFARKYTHFLKCDIRKFFESVDHEILKGLLQRQFRDQRLLNVLFKIIDHVPDGSNPGKSIPIGNLTSQYFANFYLDVLDHELKDRLRVPGYLRYMDDFILFSNSKEDLRVFLLKIREFLKFKLQLELKEKVTKLAPVTEGVPFLGFRIFRQIIRLQRSNRIRLRRNLRNKEKQYLIGKISEEQLVCSIQSVMGHIAASNAYSERRNLILESLNLA